MPISGKPGRKKTTAKKQPSASDSQLKPIDFAALPPLPSDVQTIWVDRAQLLLRSDEPIATIRFETALPEGRREAARIAMSVSHLRKLVDLICRMIEYKPTDTPSKSA